MVQAILTKPLALINEKEGSIRMLLDGCNGPVFIIKLYRKCAYDLPSADIHHPTTEHAPGSIRRKSYYDCSFLSAMNSADENIFEMAMRIHNKVFLQAFSRESYIK